VAGTSNGIVELMGRIFGVRKKELEDVRGKSDTSSIPAGSFVVVTSSVLIAETRFPMEARMAFAHAMRESLQTVEHGERACTNAKKTGSGQGGQVPANKPVATVSSSAHQDPMQNQLCEDVQQGALPSVTIPFCENVGCLHGEVPGPKKHRGL
jgi:hypothetical protein